MCQFTRLSFGLLLAPVFFKKLMKMVTSRLRREGVSSFMNLRNRLLHAPSKEKVAISVRKTIEVMKEMCFFVNLAILIQKLS